MYRVYLRYENQQGKAKEFKQEKHLRPTLTTQKRLKQEGYELTQEIYIDANFYNYIKKMLDK